MWWLPFLLFITIPSGVVSDLVTPQDFVSIVTTVEDKTSWGKVEVQNLCIQLTCIFFLVMYLRRYSFNITATSGGTSLHKRSLWELYLTLFDRTERVILYCSFVRQL